MASALSDTHLARPFDPPITNAISLLPDTNRSDKYCEKLSDEYFLPFISRVITCIPGLMFFSILSASRSLAFSIAASEEPVSGSSSASITLKVQYAERRLAYSAMASR